MGGRTQMLSRMRSGWRRTSQAVTSITRLNRHFAEKNRRGSASHSCMKWIVLLFALAANLFAQGGNHVNWSLEFSPASAAPGDKVLAKLHGKIDPGWHL